MKNFLLTLLLSALTSTIARAQYVNDASWTKNMKGKISSLSISKTGERSKIEGKYFIKINVIGEISNLESMTLTTKKSDDVALKVVGNQEIEVQPGTYNLKFKHKSMSEKKYEIVVMYGISVVNVTVK